MPNQIFSILESLALPRGFVYVSCDQCRQSLVASIVASLEDGFVAEAGTGMAHRLEKEVKDYIGKTAFR